MKQKYLTVEVLKGYERIVFFPQTMSHFFSQKYVQKRPPTTKLDDTIRVRERICTSPFERLRIFFVNLKNLKFSKTVQCVERDVGSNSWKHNYYFRIDNRIKR